MLDTYIEEQERVYKILKKAIVEKKTSHAYLFETNGYREVKQVAIAFAKAIFCSKSYTNDANCQTCKQCKNIDKNSFIELRIIEPDGMWIKKEQLDELQKEFSTKSLVTNKRVYIINHADKLNNSSANTILKFLEEPSDNIIAILIADNIYQIIETILSRCQIISFHRNKEIESKDIGEKISFYMCIPEGLDTNEKIEEKVEVIKKFIKTIEEKKKDMILFTQHFWHENFIGKEMNLFAFNLMIYFYRDMLAKKLNMKPFLFDNPTLESLAQSNEISQINEKLRIINHAKEDIKYNANIPLLLDKLIIELSDVY